MKITLAQIKFKTGDFKFDFENIEKYLKQVNDVGALVIFPQADIEDFGGKDLVFDEKCILAQNDFYRNIAHKNFAQNILIGEFLCAIFR